MEVFSVKNENKNIEKIEQKKKDIILKVKIEQLRFGYAIGYRQGGNTYTKKFLGTHCIGKPTLRKSSLLLRQFDGSVIKILGYFEGSLEFEDKFEVISIIVIICKKNTSLLGNDVLNINSTKLMIKMEKTGKLKN